MSTPTTVKFKSEVSSTDGNGLTTEETFIGVQPVATDAVMPPADPPKTKTMISTAKN